MAKYSKRRTVTTAWTDPHTGVAYTIEAQSALSAGEMRELCRWTAQLQSDLRDGSKPLVTVPHDAMHETPAYVIQGNKANDMDRAPTMGSTRYLDTAVRRMMQQPVQQQQAQAGGQAAERVVESEWRATSQLLADRFERMPRVGDRFAIGTEQWQIANVWSAFGETRFGALPIVGGSNPFAGRTFERIARNQWRAFQQSDAPVFSLSA